VTHPADSVVRRAAEVLAAKRADAEAELAALEAPPDASGGISFGKRVGDGTAIAVERLAQVAVHDGITALLADVRRAQAKVEDGTYGHCDRCGAAIPEERLDARPWATLCVSCASSSA